MRPACLIIFLFYSFNFFAQNRDVDWITPRPHGFLYCDIVQAHSSGFYAITTSGIFLKLGRDFSVLESMKLTDTLSFHNVDILKPIGTSVIYLAFNATLPSGPGYPLVRVVYKSEDQGHSWEGSQLEFLDFEDRGDTAYGLTEDGYYSSFNGGVTWNSEWQSDSLTTFDMIGDTIIYSRAGDEIRMKTGSLDSLLLDLKVTGINPGQKVDPIYFLDYRSSHEGIIGSRYNSEFYRLNHKKNAYQLLSFQSNGYTIKKFDKLLDFGQGELCIMYWDTLVCSIDTFTTVNRYYLGTSAKDRQYLLDTGMIFTNKNSSQPTGSKYRYLDKSSKDVRDLINYRAPTHCESVYIRNSGDILLFSKDSVHIWNHLTDQINLTHSSAGNLVVGGEVAVGPGVLVTTSRTNGYYQSSAISRDDGASWSKLNAPYAKVHIEGPNHFYTNTFSYDQTSRQGYTGINQTFDGGMNWTTTTIAHWLPLRVIKSFGPDSILVLSGDGLGMVHAQLPINGIQLRNPIGWSVKDVKYLDNSDILLMSGAGMWISNDHGYTLQQRGATNFNAGNFRNYQFDNNGNLYGWNKESSEIIFTSDTGLTYSVFKILPTSLDLTVGKNGTLIFHEGSRLAIYEEGYSINTVEWKEENSGLLMYPNPAHNILTIECPEAFVGEDLVLYDIRGNLVLREQLNFDTSQLDLSSLAAGSYILRISNGSNTLTKKLLILK